MVRSIPFLVLVIWLVAAPAAAAAGTQSVVARQAGVTFAANERFIRLAEVPLPAGGAPVTHTHHPGFTYAVGEPHALTVAGRRTLLAPGQAGWVGDQEEHTHARGGDAAARFYFISIPAGAGRSAAVAGVTSNLVLDTENFTLAAGSYDAVLTEVRLPAAGDAVTLPALTGPTGLMLAEGQANLGGRALPTDRAMLVRPGEAAALTSAAGGARVFALSLVPSAAAAVPPAAGAPTQLPRTGSPAPTVPVVLAAGLVGLGWLVRRRSLRP